MQKAPTTDLDLLVFEKMNKGAVILKSEKVKGQEHPLFRIIYMNPSYFEIYRLKQDKLPKGKFPLLKYLDTEQQKRLLQLKQPGDSTRFEYFHPRLQSWQKLSIYCPQPTYFAILIEDITQKKSLEQEFIESEKTLRLTLETAGEGLWQWHYSDDLIYHNRRWAQTLGLPEESTVHGLDFFLNHVHPDDIERVTAALDTAVKNEKIYFSEHRMVLDDGSIIWIKDRGLPVKDENGIFYRMVGSMVDITKYKKTQLDLFLEKEIIRSAILSVGDGIITTDRDGIIQIFNPAAENMTGWKSEQAIGMQVKDIFKLFNADMRSRNPLEKTSDSEVEDYKFSKARRGKLKIRWGGMLEIYYSVAPINMPDGQTCGHIIVFTDISELVEKQKQIEYLSFHDDLTGLYNRHYLKDALKRLDTDRMLPFTILVLDINNLKK